MVVVTLLSGWSSKQTPGEGGCFPGCWLEFFPDLYILSYLVFMTLQGIRIMRT